MKKPKALILCAWGTSGDGEIANAFKAVGGDPERVTVSSLRQGKVRLMDYDILVLPGGNSYGGHISPARIMASQVRLYLKDLKHFIRRLRPVLGIGSGFQALVKSGILPASPSGDQTAGFAANDSGRFEARWVHVRLNTQSSCLFLAGLPEMIELPAAHAEGKLVLKSPRQLEDLKKNKSIAMQYVSEDGRLLGYPYNPNGSVFNIAGLTNPEGNCLGLMPHPERFTVVHHHPNWTRQTFLKQGVGLEMFRNAVKYCR